MNTNIRFEIGIRTMVKREVAWEKGCKGKEQYATLVIAERARQVHPYGYQLNSYKCGICYSYHLGHSHRDRFTRKKRAADGDRV